MLKNKGAKNSELLHYEKLLHQKIELNEKERQRLSGERWGHIGGYIYKTCKILYTLLCCYSLFFSLVLTLGWSLDLVGRKVYNGTENKLIIISIIIVALVTSLVLLLIKRPKTVAAAIITLPACVASALASWQWYNTSGNNYIATGHYNNDFSKYWICNFPVVFLIVFVVIMMIIEIKDKRYLAEITSKTVKGLYDKKIGELRELSEDGEVGILSDEQWISVLKDYTEGMPTKKKKRSVKKREKREQKQNDEIEE